MAKNFADFVDFGDLQGIFSPKIIKNSMVTQIADWGEDTNVDSLKWFPRTSFFSLFMKFVSLKKAPNGDTLLLLQSPLVSDQS